MTPDSLLRQAENTLNRYDGMTPREQKMALRRLLKMRDDLEAERDELALELDEQYEALTPERADKYPEKYERKFGDFHGNLAAYERVSDIIGRVDAALSEGEITSVTGREEASEAHVQATEFRARSLFPVHG